MRKIVFLLAFFLFLAFPLPVKGEIGRCPSAEVREIISTIWSNWRPRFENGLRVSLEQGSPQKLYDIQMQTNNLLDYLENCGEKEQLDQLAGVYLIAYDYLSFGPGGYREWLCSSSSCPVFSSYPNKEVILHSSQFIYLLARTTNILSGLDQNELTAKMKEFLEKYPPVITNDHLMKWIDRERLFSVGGWGCADKGSYNHKEFIVKKTNRFLGSSPTYCNVIRDIDMWIAGAAAEMLIADSRSSLVNLSLEEKNNFKEDIRLVSRLLQSRLVETNLTDFSGRLVKGYLLEPGEWSDYPDWAYAGYQGQSFPKEEDKKKVASVGWDISHARRYVQVFQSLNRAREVVGQSFPNDSVLTKLANQVAYQIFNGDFEKPLFTNFWDGSNGWYRVNYSGRTGFGYAPSDLSLAFVTGGYGFWGKYNSDIDRIMAACWRLIKSNSPADITFRNDHYGRFYLNYQRTSPANFSLTDSINLLEMLPSFHEEDTSCDCQGESASKRRQGDFNCSGGTDIIDYGLWFNSYVRGGNTDEDYNCINGPGVDDFNTWMRVRENW